MLQHTRCYGRGWGCCASSSSWRRTGRRKWWCGAQRTFPYVESMEKFQIIHLYDIFKLLSTGESAIKWMLLVYNVLASLNIAKLTRIANWWLMLQDETVEYVRSNMWYPVYSPLVHEKWYSDYMFNFLGDLWNSHLKLLQPSLLFLFLSMVSNPMFLIHAYY